MTPPSTLGDLLKPIQERLEKASPGPWYKDRDFPEVKLSHDKFIVISDNTNSNCQNDCQFIAHSRLDIERLIKCVEVLSEGLEEAVYQLMRLEHADWEAEQMRLGAKSGRFQVSKIISQAESILRGCEK